MTEEKIKSINSHARDQTALQTGVFEIGVLRLLIVNNRLLSVPPQSRANSFAWFDIYTFCARLRIWIDPTKFEKFGISE